jgi:type II secretory pathway pseudopilin PulG
MRKEAAFTLLEMLVTTGITAIMMLTVTTLFISFLSTAHKSKISQNLREDGNNAMIDMINQIRNASEIVTECNDGDALTSLSLISQDGLTTTFTEENDKIASISAENGTFYLTDSADGLDRLNPFVFSCNNNESGAKYVSIFFTLKSGTGDSNSPNTSILDFSSGVALRN